MGLFNIGVLGLVSCFVLIFLGMPIAIAFGLLGFVGMWAVRGQAAGFYSLGTVPYETMSMYVWTVVPLFTLMGFLALTTGLAEEFYEGVRRWIGHFRGGLASSVILGNTGFGACTGDPVSAAVTFTAISLPHMRRFNYDDKLTLGAVCGGSVLAGFIPPSMGAILYGALTETSIGQLFIAGILPGLILTGLYVGVVYTWVRLNPAIGPPGPRATWSERWSGGKGMWALIVVFVAIIGGIYIGLFTPTEAAAFGTFTVLVIGLARKKLSWQGLKVASIQAATTIGMIGFLLVGCLMFNGFLAVSGVPTAIAEFLTGITTSPMGTMWIIIGIFFVLGMFIDGLALFLLMVPIFYPVAMDMGFHPIQFGMIILTVLSTGGLTPPFGMGVFAISAIAKDVPVYDIFRGAAPFLIAIMILEVLVVYFPQISLFLPSMMFAGTR